MTCSCGNDKFVRVSGKTGDMSSVSYDDIRKHGYVPRGLGIGGGDYIELSICIACGKVENFQPLTDEEIREILED